MSYKQINKKINKIFKWIDSVDTSSLKLQRYDNSIKYYRGEFFLIEDLNLYYKTRDKETFKDIIVMELNK